MRTPESFGILLEALTREAGLGQQELADRSGVTRDALYKLRTDQNDPSLTTLQKLAGVFGVYFVVGPDGVVAAEE